MLEGCFVFYFKKSIELLNFKFEWLKLGLEIIILLFSREWIDGVGLGR